MRALPTTNSYIWSLAGINYISKSNIFFSCTEKEHRGVENTVPDHALVYVYSGTMKVKDPEGTYTIEEGEAVLFYKNMLATFIKSPSASGAFKSISIMFSQSFLQGYYSTTKPKDMPAQIFEIKRIERHPLLISLFDSILPYYHLHGDNLPSDLTDIKLQEAITILRTVDLSTDGILANFSGPGKINFADFMLKNYSFNIPLERFAYLTGRSLATFKRDFQKVFHTAPQKWLLATRLKQAHFLIEEKNKRPSDVYAEVGFENLSHFSTAFKKYFGYPPSQLLAR
jgi:AraC family transcriptional regulator, exoenzyme S synthesis regulatory protein ExsA